MPSHPELDAGLRFDRPWFPGLAESLVGPMLATRGLTSADYGTQRWIDAASKIPPSGGQVLTDHRLEPPPPALVEPYALLGLRFAAASDAAHRALVSQAMGCLDLVPDAGRAVRALVLAVHQLQSSGPGYDVSHSDPDLPCSVFISLPVAEPHAVLRTAESILHEAMHLQLTLVEAVRPVARPGQATLYSPWQLRQRPILGVVHGLYVFTAIDAFLADLLGRDVISPDTADFAAKRRREIADEIAEVRQVAGHEDLTPFGRLVVEGLLSAPWTQAAT